MVFIYWVKELISLMVSPNGTKVEYISSYAFPDHAKRFFFCPLQSPKSSFGKYWFSYLTLNRLLLGQVHFSFLKTSINNIWILLWWLHMSLLFSNNSLNSLDLLFDAILIDLSCNLLIHSHKKRNDSRETRAVFSWISMLPWNFGGGTSDSAPTFFKTASADGSFLYDNDFHAIIIIIGC